MLTEPSIKGDFTNKPEQETSPIILVSTTNVDTIPVLVKQNELVPSLSEGFLQVSKQVAEFDNTCEFPNTLDRADEGQQPSDIETNTSLKDSSMCFLETDLPNKDEQTSQEINISSFAGGDTITVEFKPNELMPYLTVSFIQIGKRTDEFNNTNTYLCTLKQGDEVNQSFYIETNENLEHSLIDFIDMDFDGYLDMSVVRSAGNANRTFQYYRYIAKDKAFEEIPFFSAVSVDIKLFTDTKQIIVTSHDSAYSYEREMFQYSDGSYTCMRREYVESIDFESFAYDLRIAECNDEEIELFSVNLTSDEYYGDTSIRDNYLRFGKSIFE